MSGRRTSLASLAGAKVEDVPGRSDAILLKLPLDRLHCTRFNPRRRFGTDEELREFGEKLQKEQLQPAVVVSRAAYLKLWPGEADNVGTASYVVANGERRYRASQIVGRDVLEVVHREDVAASRASFLDAVQSENNDRKELDPIERAIAIETMVTELGGADQVAVYYGKTKGWVSQQRKLLKLTPDLQDLVSSGDLPVRVARDIAGLPQEVQSTAWDEEIAKRKAAKEVTDRWKTAGGPELPATATAKPSSDSERFTAVNQQPPQAPVAAVEGTSGPADYHGVIITEPAAGPSSGPRPAPVEDVGSGPAVQNPVLNSASLEASDRPEVLPEQRSEPAVDVEDTTLPEGPRRFPYENSRDAVQHLIIKMPPDVLVETVKGLIRHLERIGTPVD